MHRKFNLSIVGLLFFLPTATAFGQVSCPFGTEDTGRLARCLLRPVRRGGNLGTEPARLPAPLDNLIGRPLNVSAEKLRAYLRTRGIDEADIGGALPFTAGRFAPDLARARYFVIHDTSFPEINAPDFPTEINDASWRFNRLSVWLGTRTPTHIFVNRVGQSATKANFNQNVNGTKYDSGRDASDPAERRRRAAARAGQFIHIELVQPRRKSNPRTFFDLGPTPGMTRPQLERLAVLYVAASVRAGRWLLPAFHLAVDSPLRDAHDDPQSFDLDVWLDSLRNVLTEIETQSARLGAGASHAGASHADTHHAMPLVAAAVAATAADDFNLPEPTAATRGRRLTLWSTFYHVFPAQQLDGGRPLLGTDGRSLGVSVSERDWCNAAMEGTVAVSDAAGAGSRTFNFADRRGARQLDCSSFFRRVPRATIEALARTRFEVARGPFGTGVSGMILVPYRTIAVDGSQRPIPFGAVVFIPQARGKEIRLPSGETVRHDGYFFAADTGGLIKGNHIDVFSGTNAVNPFPEFIKSDASGTFTAHIINDPAITARLRAAHRPAH
ncbi:MAG TPA: 3D domain-containing protein [Pyrinomonadaceae bacterium]|jgi:3D (Asp-Asp-Asp) domain-containing protein